MIRGLLIGVLLVTAACEPPPADVFDGPAAPDVDVSASNADATPSGDGALYTCDTGTSLRADATERRVEIALQDGRSLDLPRIQGAAGRTYAADGWVWFEDESGAILTERGGQTLCQPGA